MITPLFLSITIDEMETEGSYSEEENHELDAYHTNGKEGHIDKKDEEFSSLGKRRSGIETGNTSIAGDGSLLNKKLRGNGRAKVNLEYEEESVGPSLEHGDTHRLKNR